MDSNLSQPTSSIQNKSKLHTSIEEDIGALRKKYLEIQKKRISSENIEKELSHKLKLLIKSANHSVRAKKSRNKSKEMSIKVKTKLEQDKEQMTKLKKNKSIDYIKLRSTILEMKMKRNQTAKLVREQTLQHKTQEASKSKLSRIEIEKKIQASKTNYLKRNQSMRDIVKQSYLKLEDKNLKVKNKKQDIIKKILISRIKEEEDLKRHYEKKVKEFQRLIIKKIEKYDDKKNKNN